MQTIGWIALGAIVGYCVAVVVDWMRKGRIAARLDGEESRVGVSDYVDWSKVPKGYDWVAIQPTETVFQFPTMPTGPDQNGDLLIKKEYGGWWINMGDAPPWAVKISASAIIGPLPDWRKSLRHRPGAAL